MRESRADSQRAIVQAIALHVALFALMFAGMWRTRSAVSVSAAGSPIEAELVDANALSAAMREVLQDRPEPAETLPDPLPVPVPVEEEAAPLPQPEPEPIPEDAPTPPQSQPQDFVVEPDTTEQDEVVAEQTPTPADEQKLQEEKRRQAQVDLTEKKRQAEAEQTRRLAAQAEEREKKLAEIRRQRAAAARQAELAEQKLKQIADARALAQSKEAGSGAASPPPGNNGIDTGLEARYAAALQEVILSKWTRPETVPLGARCRLVIKQLPGGEVMSAEVSSPCAYDEQGRRSIEAAVLKAQPLPYAGFESEFKRTLILNFEARDR